MTDAAFIVLAIALVLFAIVLAALECAWRIERMELVKMIAAKNYPEYKAGEVKREQVDHTNMIERQRQKMYDRVKQQ